MPLAAPVVAAIIGAGATGVSTAAGMIGANKAKQQSAPLIAAQTQLAQQQAAIAKLAGPALAETSDYYRQLLHGNRAQLTTALAPEISSITQLARGANAALDRGPAGPQRDVARAELGRQQVGQIGVLFPQARQAGAAGLAGIASTAMGGAGNASNIYDSLMAGVRQDQRRSDINQGNLGEGLGTLLTDFYKAWQSRGTGTTSAPTAPAGPFSGEFGGVKF